MPGKTLAERIIAFNRTLHLGFAGERDGFMGNVRFNYRF